MKLRLFAAISLLLVGVGAIALAVVGPSLAASSGPRYITAAAAVQNVAAQAVANGTIGPSSIYGLRFGAAPDILSGTGSTSTGTSASGNGSTAAGSTGSGSVTWPVTTVTATVGEQVKKGTVLATADATSAKLQLASAEASLQAAESRLATDQGGPDATTKASAQISVTQAQNSLNQAVANQQITNQQNALKLSQAQQAVTDAQNKLSADQAGGASATVIAQDQTALANAQQALQSTQLQVQQSNQQAAQAVTNAQLNLQSAQNQYASKVAPATSATVAADEAQVASAQTAVNDDQATVNDASLVAPADGLVIAVNVRAGANAPSGYGVEIESGPMVATASFAETDVPNLKVGQTASVSVTAAKATVAGTVSQISPVASTSSGTNSVVTFNVTVTLANAPATVLSGMSATVTVTTQEADNVLAIPATALQGSAANGYTVQVLNADGSVTDVPVEVGLVTNSMAQITNGLASGQRVVTGTVTTRTGTTTTGSNFGGLQNLGGAGGGRGAGGGAGGLGR